MKPETKEKIIKLFEGEFQGYLYLAPESEARRVADAVEKIVDG
jgi:hypothetical protein